MIIGKMSFYNLWKSRGATFFKKRRFNKVMRLVNLPENNNVKVLEVGCANGKDFIQFLDSGRFQIWGVDINEESNAGENVKFVTADASKLPFKDKSFDLVVSIGLLEHIEPMEKLCSAIREFDRVGRHQISIVPSISTVIEPHSGKLFFPLRMHKKLFSEQKETPLHLNFFTEHTWTKFNGFCGCRVKRIFYLPPFIRNTVIYK